MSQPSRLFTKLSRSHRPQRTISESLHIPPVTIPQWKGVENGVNEDGSHSSREFKAAKLNEIIHQFRDQHAPRNMEAAVSDFAGSPTTRMLSQIRFRHADILMNILLCRDRIYHTNRTSKTFCRMTIRHMILSLCPEVRGSLAAPSPSRNSGGKFNKADITSQKCSPPSPS